MNRYLIFLSAVVCLALVSQASAQNMLVNGGFETLADTSQGWPNTTGNWNSADPSLIVEETVFGFPSHPDPAKQSQTITPYEGTQMLMFERASGQSPAGGNGCDVWQLVDISAYSALIATGQAQADLSAWFNRVDVDAETDTAFQVRIVAFQEGDPSTFFSQINYMVNGLWNPWTGSVNQFASDDDDSTWEELTTSYLLPTDTTYLAVRISPRENVFNDTTFPEFDGHFADAAVLEIIEVPEPATMSLLTLGGLAVLRRRRK